MESTLDVVPDRTALAERVYRDLLSLIISGELGPGTRLKERDLSERLAVSRIPLRQALQALESEGFVQTELHRGATVKPVTREDIEEIFDARLCIEPYAARFAAARVHAGIESSERLHELLGKSLEPDAGADELPARLEFHMEVVRLSGNSLLSRSLQPMLGRMEWIFRLSNETRKTEHGQEHQQLHDAIASGDGELAAAQAYSHIALGRQPILAELGDALGW